jgi:hypothetical protein
VAYQLTNDEAAEVVALVREELREMSHEIAATDNSRYRSLLVERRGLLLDVVDRLTKAPGPDAPVENPRETVPPASGETDPGTWAVHIRFTEDESRTRADARMSARGISWHAWGRSRRNPADPDVPEVGEELAAARALFELSHQLVDAAAHGVESFEGHPVQIEV